MRGKPTARRATIRRVILGLCFGLLLAAAPNAQAAAQPCCGPITPDGVKLAKLLDSSGVDHLWLAHEHIVWNTGAPDPARPPASRHATHCSAFAAAMAERVGIYLLRPPEHSQRLLANAQMKWLDGGAGKQGACRRSGWSSN